LHRCAPENKYFKAKIPWRTIFISFLFFIGGVIFYAIGINELLANGISNAYEKLILGSILFIPGSYHTVLAI